MKINEFKRMLHNRLHRDELYNRPQFWDDKADEFADKAVSMWPNNHLNDFYHGEQLSALHKLLLDPKGKQILDVGCGTGRMSDHLARNGSIVTGIDFSQKSIDIAKKNSMDETSSFLCKSVFEIEDDSVYDVILCWGVITVACKNEAELSSVIKRFHRALKPNGELIFVEPIHRGFLHRVLNLNMHEFVSVVEEGAFEVEHVLHLHFWPARLALAFLPLNKIITTIGHTAGKWIMKKVFDDRAMGDYKGIRFRRTQ